jgi:hypothetical protein
VKGNMRLNKNTSLTNISGVDGITSCQGYVQVIGNTALSQCHAETTVQDIDASSTCVKQNLMSVCTEPFGC